MRKYSGRPCKIHARIGKRGIKINDFEQIKCPICGQKMMFETYEIDSNVGLCRVILSCRNLCVEKICVNINEYTISEL